MERIRSFAVEDIDRIALVCRKCGSRLVYTRDDVEQIGAVFCPKRCHGHSRGAFGDDRIAQILYAFLASSGDEPTSRFEVRFEVVETDK